MPSFLLLGNDILLLLIRFLDGRSIFRLAKCSRRLFSVLRDKFQSFEASYVAIDFGDPVGVLQYADDNSKGSNYRYYFRFSQYPGIQKPWKETSIARHVGNFKLQEGDICIHGPVFTGADPKIRYINCLVDHFERYKFEPTELSKATKALTLFLQFLKQKLVLKNCVLEAVHYSSLDWLREVYQEFPPLKTIKVFLGYKMPIEVALLVLLDALPPTTAELSLSGINDITGGSYRAVGFTPRFLTHESVQKHRGLIVCPTFEVGITVENFAEIQQTTLAGVHCSWDIIAQLLVEWHQERRSIEQFELVCAEYTVIREAIPRLSLFFSPAEITKLVVLKNSWVVLSNGTESKRLALRYRFRSRRNQINRWRIVDIVNFPFNWTEKDFNKRLQLKLPHL